jgi:hypothetical protein
LSNEAALRFSRHRAITAVMIASAALVLPIGLCAGLSPHLLLIGAAINVPSLHVGVAAQLAKLMDRVGRQNCS